MIPTVLTILGFVCTIAGRWIDNKQQEEAIRKEVEKQLKQKEEEEES